MSIIHDALKKVQSKTPGSASSGHPRTAAPLPEQAPAPPVLSPADTTRSLTILMAAVLTVAVIVIFAVIFKLANDTTQHPRPVPPAFSTLPTDARTKPLRPVVLSPAVKAPNGVVPQRWPRGAPDPIRLAEPPAAGIRVEGVMAMGGKMLALINGNVYEEGQSVNGSIITAITFENVTILENGTKKNLPINR